MAAILRRLEGESEKGRDPPSAVHATVVSSLYAGEDREAGSGARAIAPVDGWRLPTIDWYRLATGDYPSGSRTGSSPPTEPATATAGRHAWRCRGNSATRPWQG